MVVNFNIGRVNTRFVGIITEFARDLQGGCGFTLLRLGNLNRGLRSLKSFVADIAWELFQRLLIWNYFLRHIWFVTYFFIKALEVLLVAVKFLWRWEIHKSYVSAESRSGSSGWRLMNFCWSCQPFAAWWLFRRSKCVSWLWRSTFSAWTAKIIHQWRLMLWLVRMDEEIRILLVKVHDFTNFIFGYRFFLFQ